MVRSNGDSDYGYASAGFSQSIIGDGGSTYSFSADMFLDDIPGSVVCNVNLHTDVDTIYVGSFSGATQVEHVGIDTSGTLSGATSAFVVEVDCKSEYSDTVYQADIGFDNIALTLTPPATLPAERKVFGPV